MIKLPVASLLKKIVSIIIPKCLIHSYPTHNLGFNTRFPMNIGNGGVNINLASLGKNPSWSHHPPVSYPQTGYPMHTSSKGSYRSCLCFTYSTDDDEVVTLLVMVDVVDVDTCGTLTCKKYHKRKPPTPPHLELIQVDPKGRSEKSNPNWNPELGVEHHIKGTKLESHVPHTCGYRFVIDTLCLNHHCQHHYDHCPSSIST